MNINKRFTMYERLGLVLKDDEILIGFSDNKWKARDPSDGATLAEAYNFGDLVKKLSELTIEREE